MTNLSVAHRINLRRWDNGRPRKRVTWAQLRAKERMIKRKLGER